MTNWFITDESVETILDDVAIVDTHTKCGLKGKGNTFPEFRDEVDGDLEMAAFCTRNETELKLDEKIDVGNKKYTHCMPILIDMLLGLFNLVLYALYYYAVTKTALCVFVSTFRSLIFFETIGDSVFNALVSEMINVGKGIHPNATEINLTNKGRYRRPLKEVVLMDEGLALSLQRFHGRTINFVDDNGVEQSGQIEMCPSDALQRVYNYRLTKKNRNELDKRRKKWMADLRRMQKQLQKKRKKLLSLDEKILEVHAKAHAKRDTFEKKRADAAAKRKEGKALRDNEMAVEANKRAKKRATAFALLSTLST
eukprot:scaffold8495_cov125-Skeletonema_menzelii.AAC.4